MFRKVITSLKPAQLLSRRFASSAKSAPVNYAPNQTLTNGTKGQNVLYQARLLLECYKRQLPTAIKSTTTVTFAMIGWCWLAMIGTDALHDVPLEWGRTAAVKVVKYGNRPVIEFQ